MMVNGMWMEWIPFGIQIHPFLRANSQHKPKNHTRKRKAMKEKCKSGAEGDPYLCVPDSMAMPPPPRVARGGGCPVRIHSLFHFVASSFALPCPWYLLRCVHVGSFWAALSFLLWSSRPKKHLLISCLVLAKSKSVKIDQNKQNHA